MIGDNEDHELKSIKGYRKKKLCADGKRQFYMWLVVRTLEDVNLIRYIQIFARKRIILIKYICIEFDMFTENEMIYV